MIMTRNRLCYEGIMGQRTKEEKVECLRCDPKNENNIFLSGIRGKGEREKLCLKYQAVRVTWIKREKEKNRWVLG